MCGSARLESSRLWDSFEFDARATGDIKEWMRLAVFMNDELWRKKLLRFITGNFTLPRYSFRHRPIYACLCAPRLNSPMLYCSVPQCALAQVTLPYCTFPYRFVPH